MMILLLNRIKKFVKSEKGDGISIVIYGTIVMMVFIFTAVNFLNGKIIEEKFNTLKDAVESAAAGSVVHLLTGENAGSITQNKQNTDISYDVYLQLALGYLINYEGQGNVAVGATNNFIRIDHAKAVESTLELISKSVLGQNKDYLIKNPDKYSILMFFIEPSSNYDKDYRKTYDLIVYRTDQNGMYNETTGYKGTVFATNLTTYTAIEEAINNQVNSQYVNGTLSSTKGVSGYTQYNISLGANSKEDQDSLLRSMGDYPYYLIVVKDFKLPSLLSSDTSKGSNILVMNDGKLKKPIATLQAGKVERKVFD